jgi:hypothetical protein
MDQIYTLQLIVIFEVFVLIHILISRYLVDLCSIKCQGNKTVQEPRRITKKEMGRVLISSIVIMFCVTIFLILFFYWTINSFQNIIEITSNILWISGVVFIAEYSLSILPTYYGRIVIDSDYTGFIKRYIHLLTGLLLLIMGYGIKIYFLFKYIVK